VWRPRAADRSLHRIFDSLFQILRRGLLRSLLRCLFSRAAHSLVYRLTDLGIELRGVRFASLARLIHDRSSALSGLLHHFLTADSETRSIETLMAFSTAS